LKGLLVEPHLLIELVDVLNLLVHSVEPQGVHAINIGIEVHVRMVEGRHGDSPLVGDVSYAGPGMLGMGAGES
jgi:hypothetical protein